MGNPLFRVTSIVLIIVGIVRVLQPLLFQYFISYVVLMSSMMYKDEERMQYAKEMSWQMEWRLHQFEMAYNKGKKMNAETCAWISRDE